jgi:hypothetical protein
MRLLLAAGTENLISSSYTPSFIHEFQPQDACGKTTLDIYDIQLFEVLSFGNWKCGKGHLLDMGWSTIFLGYQSLR